MFGIGPAGWPGSPKLHRGFPVSAVGEAVGGVSEVAGAEKIGGNGVEGTSSKDMTDDKRTFEARKMS